MDIIGDIRTLRGGDLQKMDKSPLLKNLVFSSCISTWLAQ